MSMSEIFQINKGITAIIGGGGKTSFMYKLAKELSVKGRVIVCTSAKILIPEHIPVAFTEDEIQDAFEKSNVVCVGSLFSDEKLSAPEIPFSRLKELCDYVLAEADGSKHLPFKAHGEGEPPIPEEAENVILVMGINAIGKPIEKVCHRAETACEILGKSPSEIFSVSDAAQIINTENLHDIVFINQVESEEAFEFAKALARLIKAPVIAGSLKEGWFKWL